MPSNDPHNHQLLDPLGHTSEQFVAAAVQARLAPASTSLEAYRRMLRTGAQQAGPGKVSLSPIVNKLQEASPEGDVVKFVQRLSPSQREGPGVGSTSPDASPVADAAPVSTGLGNLRISKDSPLDIESVLIPMIGSNGQRTYTLCVSSQVGCAMGCTFCETAQMGLIRSLTAAEIVGQWFAARHVIGIFPKNIVFMGMGEPMDNFDNVMQAVAILKDHNGAGVPISNITISTVGRVDGIRRMAEQIKQDGWHRLNLALSLNAPNDSVRSGIMPVNRRWNMAEVQQALLEWPKFAGNKICIEYVLIPGVNDGREHIAEVAAFMLPFKFFDKGKPRALINLIPYNPRRNSPWPAPTEEKVEEFLSGLIEAGVFAKRRRTKGRTMMGACGQLGAAHIRQRRLVQPTISA